MRKEFAFTMAEVIITLGLIGVIAAISIPTLVANTQKRTVEAKLTRFYAEMNQAIKVSSVETGKDVDGWIIRGKEYKTKAELDDFVDTYLRPTLNIAYTKYITPNPRACSGKCPRLFVVLENGIAFSMYIDGNGIDIFMHPNPDKTTYNNPRESFAFQMIKRDTGGGDNFYTVDSMEPYTANWNGKLSELTKNKNRGCNRSTTSNKQFCTKWVELNNWKLPKDYPW